MSLRSLESMLCHEARHFFNNRSLRIKDILQWSTSLEPVKNDAREGEVYAVLPISKIAVCISASLDKRKPEAAMKEQSNV
jgi:hypothetical protein